MDWREKGGACGIVRAIWQARDMIAPMERSGRVAGTIAIFDDDAAILDAMRDALTGEGYRVVTATMPDDALVLVLRERPALVILDFWMGGQPAGLQALRVIREHPEIGAMPVLICSADRTALLDYAEDWRALGCETLAKPFDLYDLLERVARLTA
jgi:DNA-binding response OmpR family regulator